MKINNLYGTENFPLLVLVAFALIVVLVVSTLVLKDTK